MHCAQRTLPGTIDAIARDAPTRTWGRFPESQEAFEQGKLVTVNFATLANSINRVAWVLDALLPERSDLDTIAYIGPSDIRYYILACAACKCRLKALFSSPRNNISAHLSLLESTSCRTILQPREKPLDGFLQSLIERHDTSVFDLPTLEEILSLETADAFPWDKAYSDVADEPFVVLHTSGSTGNPKQINIKHSLIACVDAQQLLSDVDNRHVTAREWANRRLYNALPPFHAAGLNFFAYSIFQSTEFLLGPSGAPPSLTTVELVLKYDMADAGILPPSLLSEAAADANLLNMFSKWSCVIYGGGPLTQDAGDALQTKLKVLRALGSTETFNLPELLPEFKEDWPYNCFHPYLGIDFRERMDGLYELVVVRQPDQAEHQGAFCTFPELEEYAMKDLYRKHPHKPNLWRYCGRLDDIIVLSNGEKFNPSDAESEIMQNPDVKSALVVGTGREQPALLVEPCNRGLSDERRQCIIAKATSANELLPAPAQIYPSHVRVLDSPDTFLRSSKGEVQRSKTISALNDTIEELYATAERNAAFDRALDLTDREQLTKSLVGIISQELLRGKHVSPDDNIFDLGLDSLQVTRLLRYVRAGIQQQDKTLGASITPRAIYQNPSATSLAKTLSQLITGQLPSPVESDSGEADFQSILEFYASRLDVLERSDVIVLTGSTGSLGSYFLDSLIRKRSFSTIICLNRRGGNVDKQRKIHQARGLTNDFSDVEFFEAKLAEPRLGLSEQQYSKLVNEATHIFHGAWEVNFNLPMTSFTSQLEGCYRLVELAHDAVKHAAVTFISSVGAANHWAYVYDGSVPEQALGDFAVAEPMGYAQSKLLAELLFLDASKRLSIPLTICRVGQIAGPVKSKHGAWNSNEWFPSIALTAKALGLLPDTLGAMDRIDWLPVDILGDMLVEAVVKKQIVADQSTRKTASVSAAEFLHFVNPHHVHWSEIASKLASHIMPRPRVVSYEEWLQALTVASVERSDDIANLPAMKLLDFFQDIGRGDAKRPVFSTAMTELTCPILGQCGAISISWLLLWMRQWGLDVNGRESCAN